MVARSHGFWMSLRLCQWSARTRCGEAAHHHNRAETLDHQEGAMRTENTLNTDTLIDTETAKRGAQLTSYSKLNVWVPKTTMGVLTVRIVLFNLCREKPRQERPGADPRQSQRPARSSRDDGRPHQQPRGQEPSRHKEPDWSGGPAPPPQHRERDREPRDYHDQVVRREGANDKRPKSSYTGRDSSPQSPREKRPLSGPNIRTPNLPVTEGVIKTAQQTSRPFNTYPRSESDSGRSPSSQVHINKMNVYYRAGLLGVVHFYYKIIAFFFSGGPLSALTCCVNVRLLSGD